MTFQCPDKHNVKTNLTVMHMCSHQQKTAAPVRSPSMPHSLFLSSLLLFADQLHCISWMCLAQGRPLTREEGQVSSCKPRLSRAFASLVNSRSSQGSWVSSEVEREVAEELHTLKFRSENQSEEVPIFYFIDLTTFLTFETDTSVALFQKKILLYLLFLLV